MESGLGSFIRQRVVLSDLITHCNRVQEQIRDPSEVWMIGRLFIQGASMRTVRGLRNSRARREGDVSAGIDVDAERLRCRLRLQSVILFSVYHVLAYLTGLSNIAVRSTQECQQQ